MMCCEPEQEIDTFACGECRKPVLTFWLVKGGLLRGQYDLLGDVVFHRECTKAYLKREVKRQWLREWLRAHNMTTPLIPFEDATTCGF